MAETTKEEVDNLVKESIDKHSKSLATKEELCAIRAKE